MFLWWRDFYTLLTLIWLLAGLALVVALILRRRRRAVFSAWVAAGVPWAFISAGIWRSGALGISLRADAPASTLALAGGKTVPLRELRGKVVLLDFWATWCPPCRASAPAVAQLARDFAPRGLVVVAVSQDEDEQAWRGYLQLHREPRVEALDGAGTVAKAFRVEGKPTFVLLDRAGRLRWRLLGWTPYSYPLLRYHIGRLVRETL